MPGTRSCSPTLVIDLVDMGVRGRVRQAGDRKTSSTARLWHGGLFVWGDDAGAVARDDIAAAAGGWIGKLSVHKLPTTTRWGWPYANPFAIEIEYTSRSTSVSMSWKVTQLDRLGIVSMPSWESLPYVCHGTRSHGSPHTILDMSCDLGAAWHQKQQPLAPVAITALFVCRLE